jgi:hypothetical protein
MEEGAESDPRASESEEDTGSASACASKLSSRERLMKSSPAREEGIKAGRRGDTTEDARVGNYICSGDKMRDT